MTRGQPVGRAACLHIVAAGREERLGLGRGGDCLDRTTESIGCLRDAEEAHPTLEAGGTFVEDRLEAIGRRLPVAAREA